MSIDTAALEGAPGSSAVTTADAADLQSRLGGTALLPGDPGNVSDGAIAAFADVALDRPAPLTVVNVWHMGGAINSVGPEASAFGKRSADYLVSIDGNWPDAALDPEGIEWVRAAWSAIGRFGTGRWYLNFTGLSDEPVTTSVEGSYGPNLARLAAVKAAYDPANLFSRTNNITPAPAAGT